MDKYLIGLAYWRKQELQVFNSQTNTDLQKIVRVIWIYLKLVKPIELCCGQMQGCIQLCFSYVDANDIVTKDSLWFLSQDLLLKLFQYY